MHRRAFLIISGITAVAGCMGAEDEEPENEPANADPPDENDETANETPVDETDSEVENSVEELEDGGAEEDGSGIEIEYRISDPKTHDEVPEEVVEHPNPEDFYWVVVTFKVTRGEFDAADIVGLTQLRIGDESHFTRAVIITAPDERIVKTGENYMMETGAEGEAYYRVSEHEEDLEWVVEQLRNQHGDVEIIRAD